jgi:hypothetical protein
VRPPHAAGLVKIGERALHQLAALTQKPLAAGSPDPAAARPYLGKYFWKKATMSRNICGVRSPPLPLLSCAHGHAIALRNPIKHFSTFMFYQPGHPQSIRRLLPQAASTHGKKEFGLGQL